MTHAGNTRNREKKMSDTIPLPVPALCRFVSAISAILLCIAPQLVTADEWDDADLAIRRLDPAEFQELPAAIVTDLKKRGCTIPQAANQKKRHNVISGGFVTLGQKDWAVLCSRDRISSVLIFWGRASPCSSEILSSNDRDWLQNINDGIGYSRVISTVTLVSIPILKSIAGPSPLPMTAYHGIKEEFLGKASAVHYCHNGVWVRQEITD